MKEEEEHLPEQQGRELTDWEVCGLGGEGAGRWPCSAQHRDVGAAAVAASTLFCSRPAKLAAFPGMLHMGFVAALYFMFSLLSRADIGVLPFAPILTPKSSYISDRNHSVAARNL